MALLDSEDYDDIDLPKSTKHYAAEELEGLRLVDTRKKEKYLSGMAIGLSVERRCSIEAHSPKLRGVCGIRRVIHQKTGGVQVYKILTTR